MKFIAMYDVKQAFLNKMYFWFFSLASKTSDVLLLDAYLQLF